MPDLWNGELNTSTVFVGRLDPLPAPLTPQQQTERPYAIGTMEIIPDPSTKFTKKGELSTFMLIYNAKTDAANKPDVIVEYNFYAKQAGAEKFFNKTNPQNLNAQTLPPQFDFARAISSRPDRPCRSGRSRKATTASRSRSPTSSRTRRSRAT